MLSLPLLGEKLPGGCVSEAMADACFGCFSLRMSRRPGGMVGVHQLWTTW